jgi:hypothetical protein
VRYTRHLVSSPWACVSARMPIPSHPIPSTGGRSTPHALTPPMAGGPMRPVLNASLSNPGYEVKSRYSPTMEGNNGDQNQAQAQAQGHHARWRPY